MIKRLLVTGGCGFIGANLVPKLIGRGYRIRVLDDLSRGFLSFIDGLEVEFVEGDIRSSADTETALRGVDGVIHLAAYGSVVESLKDPQTNFEINAGGTLNVLDGAKRAGVTKFVFASTGGALVGDADPPVNERSLPSPKSPYGASKLTCEAYCSAYAQSFDLPTVMLRFANIYGPFSAHKKGAVTAFSKSLISGDPIAIYGDGSASRDFLHVDDLCSGIIKAMEKDLPPATILHLATGRETTILELANLLRKVAGKPEHRIRFEGSRAGEVHRNFATYDRAASVLGFKPSVVLEEGLARTWQWFLDQGEQALQMEMSDS
jgi:UDP-glucose 4-epimerase